MTPAELLQWRKFYFLRAKPAYEALGCAPQTYASWETGKTAIPRYIALACTALACALGPWPIEPNKGKNDAAVDRVGV